MANWTDYSREDLKMIPEMMKHGWMPDFHENDVRYKRTTPDNIPHNSIRFIKGQIHIWLCKDGWQVAELIDGQYLNHRGQVSHTTQYRERFFRGYIPDLTTVLELESKNDL